MGPRVEPPLRRLFGLIVAASVLGVGSLVARRGLRPPSPAPLPATPAPQPAPHKPQSATPAPQPASHAPQPTRAELKPPVAAGPLPFDLVEASSATGTLFLHRGFRVPAVLANIDAWMASTGVGVAVADVDGDGLPDIYVTNTDVGSRNALFLNRGDGTFREDAAGWGLADLNARSVSTRPLFVDIDNDGDKDLFLTTNFCPQLYRNEGRRFSPVPEAGGLDYCGLALASNALDYDGDGDLDLVLAGYFPEVDFSSPTTFSFMQNSLTSADNGGQTLVYENLGAGRFRRGAGEGMPAGRHWTNAIGVWDFDDDGRPDLFFATDYNGDRVYLNRGGGRFEDASRALDSKYSRSGMNADVAEVFEEGRPAVFVTHIYEPPFKIGNNTLWTWTGKRDRFEDRGTESGAGTCGWAWAGRFVDLDLDGREDLVVTNGYISANPAKNYWYRMDLLASAAREVLADARNWAPFEDYSMSGYQKKCVYLNDGSRLRRVTEETGMKDDLSDGRAVASIDARDTGTLDLVMGNQRMPLRYYRNLPRHKNAWIGFKLVGTRSNRDAWGARVRLRSGGRTLTRRLFPANAYMSQSDDRLVFGLGTDPAPESVEVRWPSGTTQVFKDLAPGRYHRLVEPR